MPTLRVDVLGQSRFKLRSAGLSKRDNKVETITSKVIKVSSSKHFFFQILSKIIDIGVTDSANNFSD